MLAFTTMQGGYELKKNIQHCKGESQKKFIGEKSKIRLHCRGKDSFTLKSMIGFVTQNVVTLDIPLHVLEITIAVFYFYVNQHINIILR
jgi:hypothetical protein